MYWTMRAPDAETPIKARKKMLRIASFFDNLALSCRTRGTESDRIQMSRRKSEIANGKDKVQYFS